MGQPGSQWNRHNELIRSLTEQLEATELELAKEKWLFEQFLKSPSWRLTSPLRWLARQGRAVRRLVTGAAERTSDFIPQSNRDRPQAGNAEPDAGLPVKAIFETFYRVQLRSFLSSGGKLEFPSSASPKVSIILVLHNRAELTLACLRSMVEDKTPMEVIIADNASTDDTPHLLEQLQGVRIIRNTENLHFLRAANNAAHQARGEYLLFLNNDAQLLPGSLEAAMKTLAGSPDIGAVGARIVLFDGMLQEAGSIVWRDGSCVGYGRGDDPFAPMYMFRRDVDYCSGAFFLTPRPVWEQLGGFDEAFSPAYYEETDYCVRLWESGFRVVYEPRAAIYHYEFGSSASIESATGLQREHKEIFAAKHAGFLAGQFTNGHESILRARMRSAPKRVLFIDDRTPHTRSGSGFPRARTILLSLSRRYFVSVYPVAFIDEDWDSVYSDLPAEIEVLTGMGRPLLEAFLRNRRGYYDAILISRPHNMRLLKPLITSHADWFENVNIIYDAEALFTSRAFEQVEYSIEEEARFASLADCVIAVCDQEAANLQNLGVRNVSVLGHSLVASPTPKRFSERKGFLFVGPIYGEKTPNGDSIVWFLTEILPRIRQTLGAETSFTIAGMTQSETIRELAAANSVQLPGYVPDLSECYDSARVFVAPTRFGAGIPHKVHEAAARGVPVVATPLLAGQLGWRDGSTLAVGADSAEFAAKCVELYTNESLWTGIREAALNAIHSECSTEMFENRLTQILEGERTNAQHGIHRRTVHTVPTRTD